MGGASCPLLRVPCSVAWEFVGGETVDWVPVIKDIEVLIEDRSDSGILSNDLLLTNLRTG